MSSDIQPAALAPFHAALSEGGFKGALARFYDRVGVLGYAALRVAFGLILVGHGLPKLFGGSHGAIANPKAMATDFIRSILHFPVPEFFANVVMFLETGGAVMLALGLLTRVVAPMIAFEMAMICIVLSPNWAWNEHGMEYAVLMGFVALLFATGGSGPISVDRWISGRIRAVRVR